MNRQVVKVRVDFDIDGKPTPLLFKFVTDEKDLVTVKVGRITKRDLNFYAGNRMYVYYCESFEVNMSKPYELRYEIDTCKWYLYY